MSELCSVHIVMIFCNIPFTPTRLTQSSLPRLASYASWWWWHPQGREHPTSPPVRGQQTGHLCHGQREHGWYQLGPAPPVGLAGVIARFSWEILEWSECHKFDCATKFGRVAGGGNFTLSWSNREGFPSHDADSAVLQEPGWPKQTTETIPALAVHWGRSSCFV